MSIQQAQQQASDFTLTHLTGRTVSLHDFRGRPVAVIFGGKDSSEQAKQMGLTLRSRYNAEQLPILSVLHLPGLPRLIHGLIKRQVEKDYQRAIIDETAMLRAAGRPVPDDPSEFVIMLPDWEGKMAASFGLSGINEQAVGVMVDGNGYIRGYGVGAQGGQQLLSLFA